MLSILIFNIMSLSRLVESKGSFGRASYCVFVDSLIGPILQTAALVLVRGTSRDVASDCKLYFGDRMMIHVGQIIFC